MNKFANDNTRVFVLLTVILCLIYWQTLAYPFQFDDFNVIVNRQDVHSLQAWWQAMPSMRPLLKLTYALNWQLDHHPFYFRCLNLCCHIAASFLTFVLVKNLLPFLIKNKTSKYGISANQFNLIALLSALLFALHPAHTEVVIYISSRSTGLMSLFCLASITAYLRWLINKEDNHFILLSILFWFAAVLVKEVALILPALFLWIIYFVAPQKLSWFAKAELKEKGLIFFVLLMPLLWVLYIPQYTKLLTSLSQIQLQNLVNQPYAHMQYLTNTLFGIGLNIDYSGKNITNFQTIAASLGIIALLYFCISKRKQWPIFSFAVGWWFISLLPTNSIIYRPDLLSDRQIYLASVGMLMLLSAILVRTFQYMPKQLSLILVLIPVIYFGLANFHRATDYQTESTLWQSSLKQNRFNARAWNNLGYAYQLAGDHAKAKDCYENAIILNHNHQKALHNLRWINSTLK
jgi:protein O-mannosyl-transferase